MTPKRSKRPRNLTHIRNDRINPPCRIEQGSLRGPNVGRYPKMTGGAAAIKSCPRCGYVDPFNDNLSPEALFRPWHIRGPNDVHAYVASLGEETHEWLLALFADRELNLLSVETVGRGPISSVEVKFNAIFWRGHGLGAEAFVLVHNHPSGDPRPSHTDIRFTNRLRWLSHELDMPLLDHFIVAGGEMTRVGGW